MSTINVLSTSSPEAIAYIWYVCHLGSTLTLNTVLQDFGDSLVNYGNRMFLTALDLKTATVAYGETGYCSEAPRRLRSGRESVQTCENILLHRLNHSWLEGGNLFH